MTDVTIDASDLERWWRREFLGLARQIPNALRKAVEAGADEARTTARFKDRTGALRASIQGHLTNASPVAAEGVMEANVPHASFVEAGTAPHEIRPKRGAALRWADAGGAIHFARAVQHPGTRPDGFMGRAVVEAERVLEREIEVAVDRIASREG